MTDGTTVRVPLPELNEERRRELVKIAHQYAENARIAVRHVRRDGMDTLKRLEKDGEISQDESRDKPTTSRSRRTRQSPQSNLFWLKKRRKSCRFSRSD
jgi:ribosome recycling factor